MIKTNYDTASVFKHIIQWFSNFSEHQNHLKTYRLLGPPSELQQVRYSGTLEFAFLVSKWTKAADLGPQSEITAVIQYF